MSDTPNPPAFPTSFNADYPHEMTGGLTMRDYFAAKAMQGMFSNPDYTGPINDVVTAAYQASDAMLKARDAK